MKNVVIILVLGVVLLFSAFWLGRKSSLHADPGQIDRIDSVAFSYRPSFEPQVYVNVLKRDSGEIVISGRIEELHPEAGEEKVISKSSRIIDEGDLDFILQIINDGALKKYLKGEENGPGLDGSDWSLTVMQNDFGIGYRVWIPVHDPKLRGFTEACIRLMDMTGLEIDESELY